MTDPTDVLLVLWKEEREQVRQAEIQRATLTNIVIVVAAAGIGFVAQRGRLDAVDLCVSVPMFFLGSYGALTCWKYRERIGHHGRQMRRLYDAIGDLHPEIGLAQIASEVDALHYARFPWMVNVRLYTLWIGLHIGVALGGAGLSMWVLVAA